MRLDDGWSRRLDNWARWRLARQQGGRLPPQEMKERVDRSDGWDAPAVIPTNDAEAAETEAGVMALPSVQRAAVEAFYLHPGGLAARALALCCSVTTMRERVALAHVMLGQWLYERRARMSAERARVVAGQRR